MNSRTRARLAVGGTALVLPLAFAITACSGSSSPTAAASATASSTKAAVSAVSASTGAAVTGTTGKTVKVPKYVAADNARKAVATTSCEQAGSKGWTLKGTATNSKSAAQTYSVVVDFVTTKGDTVLDTKVLSVGPVKSKSTVHWSATGAAGEQNVSCVIRQVLTK